VGSATLDMSKAVGPLLNELTKLPIGTTVLLRRPANGDPGHFEQVCAQICGSLRGFDVVFFSPDTEQYSGRAATYERDIRMASVGDKVLAFFPANKTMLGGTGHVVEKFHDLGKSSTCFEVNIDGSYVWSGGMEPEDPYNRAQWTSSSRQKQPTP
jgi:hypothetical protein